MAAELPRLTLPDEGAFDPVAPGAPAPIDLPSGATWSERLRRSAGTWVPIAALALLAVYTGWLVQHQDGAPDPARSTPRGEPDYVLQGFTLEHFDAQGQPQARVSGDQMRHYPGTDTVEVDGVRVDANPPGSQPLQARAKLGLVDPDARTITLRGGVVVTSTTAQGDALRIEGEQLVADTRAERLYASSPVTVQRGASHFSADGLQWDQRSQVMQLTGKVQARLMPAARR